jgi:ribosomal protein S18 acetylase RimI-like enzyme
MTRDDLPALADILNQTELFPSEMLEEMAKPFLTNTAPHIWLVIHDENGVAGFAYCEPERMTDNTFNLLAIAVDPSRQRGGLGSAIVMALTESLAQIGGRILLVETSSLPKYVGTRAFYDGLGFTREACIREFYSIGEDKIIFWRKL